MGFRRKYFRSSKLGPPSTTTPERVSPIMAYMGTLHPRVVGILQVEVPVNESVILNPAPT